MYPYTRMHISNEQNKIRFYRFWKMYIKINKFWNGVQIFQDTDAYTNLA